jgi:hypothetical protein
MTSNSKPDTVAAKVERYLVPLLGPNTARIAVRTFAAALQKKTDQLNSSDLLPLAEKMQAMLKNLLGEKIAAKALKEISEL